MDREDHLSYSHGCFALYTKRKVRPPSFPLKYVLTLPGQAMTDIFLNFPTEKIGGGEGGNVEKASGGTEV